MRIALRVLAIVVAVIVLLLIVVMGLLMAFHIPSNAAGMAAKGVCSATFVAGRDDGQDVFAEDISPASPAFDLISTDIQTDERSVTARFLGLFQRRASLLPDRGCVLDEEPDPAAKPYSPAAANPAPWPEGDAVLPRGDWGAGVDAEALQKVVDDAFVGEGDPASVNARGVAIVHDGRLLIERVGSDFRPGTGLHGWSMTKTVAAMLFWKKAQQVGLDVDTAVVDAFPSGNEPGWVEDWRQDDRRAITVADLLFMRSGLDIGESYEPWGSVVQMLYGEPNMASWAAEHSLGHAPGSFWEYSSGGSNILSQVTQGQFDEDPEYWRYPYAALFDPIGADSATLETDTYGTWVGSSYLWADVGDWARLGQVMMADGRWGDEQVFPRGWVELATTPAMPDGEGHGYGAQTWLPGAPNGGECSTVPGVPQDTMSMDGHWGQIVAMVPSRDAVIVRLGWTIDSTQFDSCQFISDVVAALPEPGGDQRTDAS